MVTKPETNKRAWARLSTWTAIMRLNPSDNVMTQPSVKSTYQEKPQSNRAEMAATDITDITGGPP